MHHIDDNKWFCTLKAATLRAIEIDFAMYYKKALFYRKLLLRLGFEPSCAANISYPHSLENKINLHVNYCIKYIGVKYINTVEIQIILRIA